MDAARDRERSSGRSRCLALIHFHFREKEMPLPIVRAIDPRTGISGTRPTKLIELGNGSHQRAKWHQELKTGGIPACHRRSEFPATRSLKRKDFRLTTAPSLIPFHVVSEANLSEALLSPPRYGNEPITSQESNSVSRSSPHRRRRRWL